MNLNNTYIKRADSLPANFWEKNISTHFNIFEEFPQIFDRNRDGYIDMKELKKVTQMLGTMLTKEEIEDFMAEADKDGNGKLDYDEFVKMLLQYWYGCEDSKCVTKCLLSFEINLIIL